MKSRTQHGIALITVLLMIALLSLIGLAAMQSAAVQTRIARAQQQMDYARNLADAGLQQARTYINTGNTSNYKAHSTLPFSTSYSVDSQSASITVSPSTNGIYPLTSSTALSSGSSETLYGRVRRPMAPALLAGSIQLSAPSSLNGLDQCGSQHLVGLASAKASSGAAIKNGGSLITGATAAPSVVLNMTMPEITTLIGLLAAAGIPNETIGSTNNYNTVRGDPTSDTTCHNGNMYVLHSTGNVNLKANGCGLLLIQGDLTVTNAHWRGLALVGGAFEAKGNGTALSSGITGAVISTGTGSNPSKAVNSLKDGGFIRWCSTTAEWANSKTRETGGQLWFSHWNNISP
jgi:type II secretory pathway pseudopilin PulG